MSLNRVALPLLAVVLAGAVVGCGQGGAVTTRGAPAESPQDESPGNTRPRMGPEEIPDEFKTPGQRGDGSAQSFSDFLALTDGNSIRWAPLPPDMAALASRSAVVVGGEVVGVRLEASEERLGGEVSAGRIDLVMRVLVNEPVKGAETGKEIVIREAVWRGDTVLSETLLERMGQELGGGPVGSQVALFATGEGQAPGELNIIDGLINDTSGTFRLALPSRAASTDYLRDIPSALADAAATGS